MYNNINIIERKITRQLFLLLAIFAAFFFTLPSLVSAQVAQGDGQYFYGIQSDTMPYSKAYVNSSNTFSATSTTVASGTAVVSVIKASPERSEMVAGYITSAGVLNIVCYDGATWTNEWSANVGGAGSGATTTRRFDIGYESDTGDVMVLYSGNVATTNELRYQTKLGSTGCGSGNWSGATNLDPVRSTSTVQWVKIAEDKRATSTLMTAIWADGNSDLSAMVWSGSAWGNEHTTALETALEVISAAQDTESFDVAYESLSGDVMVAWGSGGTNGTNGAYYAVCTGGTSSCTWGSVRTAMPTFLDDASHISIAADPLSDRIVFASIGNAGADVQNGIWSGTAWTNAANADTGGQAPVARRMFVATGWLNNNGHKRAVVTYYQSAQTNIGWRTATGTTWSTETDFTPTTALGTQTHYSIEMNPFNQSELMFTVANNGRQGFGKRLVMASDGTRSWTDSDGGVLAGGINATSTDFAYLRYVPPPTLRGVLYSDAGVTDAGSGKNLRVYVGTSTPSIFSATTIAGGVWEFSSSVFTSATSGTPFIIWVDGDANDATTVVSGYTGTEIANVPLYYNHVIVSGAATSSSVNYEAFSRYDYADDADILFENASGLEIYDADFLIHRGTFVAPPNLILQADFVNRGTFLANGGVVTLQGTGIFDGVLTGTSSFSSLIFNTSGSYAFATSTASTSVIRSSAGALTAPSTALTIGREFYNGGNFIHSSGTVYANSNLSGKMGERDVSGGEGTSSVTVNNFLASGQYLYVATNGDGTACSQNEGEAIGCEIQVYDITDPTAPIYLAGRDSGGSPTGPRVEAAASLAIKDNTLYVGKEASSDDCNPVVGSASGCELLMFDISDPTNPTFVTALDGDGSVSGDEMNLFLTLEIEGNYLYTTKYNSGNACSQTPGSAEGCELQVFDISSSTNPVYVAGRDVDGSTNGTGYQTVWGSTIAGDYWFITTSGAASACSQTPGSAVGCELQIYDISTRTNPTYIAGMDASAVADGDTGNIFFDVAVSESGNTLYVAAAGAEFDCDTNNYSCELHVYNITNPATPTFITGRDASGVFTDNEIGAFTKLHVRGDYLYVFKAGSATACSQVAGAATGCELQVYNIASTTNPIYVAGGDASGVENGTSAKNMIGAIGGNYIFGGTVGSATYCGSGATTAEGCEILVFQAGPSFTGILNGEISLYNLTVSGVGLALDDSNVTVENNMTIQSGLVQAPPEDLVLTVGGNYVNQGTFDANGGTVVLSALGGTASGTMTGASAFNNVEVTGSTTFSAAASTTSFTVATGATTTAPASTLSVTNGNFANRGYFNNNNGLLDIENIQGEIFEFLSGRDASGSAAGTGGRRVAALASKDNYLYVAKLGTNTACSQTPGSAIGCELLVFDVSDPNNPVMVAARDVDGAAAGGGYTSQTYESLVVQGDYLYAGKTGNADACSQSVGSATGCEIQVYDITDPANPIYVAGRDASGSAAGTTGDFFANEGHVLSLSVLDGYLYVAKSGEGTACSQTPGSAIGCELMVFDIIDPADPTYVAGRDAGGNAAGDEIENVNTVVAAGDHVYIGKNEDFSACSQTPGMAEGCELMVFDISDPTDPTYVAGRDGAGSEDGQLGDFDGVNILSIVVHGDYLYVGRGGSEEPCGQTPGLAYGCELMIYDISNPVSITYISGMDFSGIPDGVTGYYGTDSDGDRFNTLTISGDYLYVGASMPYDAAACSQTPGEAEACELQIYDISNPVNPIYVAGRDGNGAADGAEGGTIHSLIVIENTVYAGKWSDTTACSQTTGSANGCEIIAFTTTGPGGFIRGNLTGTSALNNVSLGGVVSFLNNATTSNLTIQNGTTTLPSALTVRGNYLNQAGEVVFGEQVYFDSNSAQSIQDTPDGLTLRDTTFIGTGTKTLVGGATTSNVSIMTAAPVISSGELTILGRYDNSGILTSQNEMTVSGSYTNTGTTSIAGELVLGGSYTNTGLSQPAGEIIMASDGFAYVAGRDTQGSDDGSSGANYQAAVVDGNYLYVGRYDSYTTCSQTPGSAEGCELQVYDISDPTDPTFVAGRDSNGSASGAEGQEILSLTVSGDYLYVGMYGGYVNCSQTPGSAHGCELLVYDISDPTDPTFVAGRDIDGSATGDVNESSIRSLIVSGNYLYAGTDAIDGADTCSQTPGSAEGCELQVYDITTPTSPTFVAGRDGSGSAGGSFPGFVDALAVSGNYLYIGHEGDPVACSQTPGSAEGCELQVYDITTPTSPTFVAGRDGSGSASGAIGAITINALTTVGDYLYVGKFTSPGTCSQTPGSAHTCELMVFDITTPTSPTFVAGRDVDGDEDGTSWTSAQILTTDGNYLYVGLDTEAVPCSQTAGSAEGCEIQVYDISDLDNPTFAAGRDITGSSDGNETGEIKALAVSGNYLYAGTDGQQSTCSQTPGLASGCELQVYELRPTFSGNLTGSNGLHYLAIGGAGAIFANNASTTDINIFEGTVTGPTVLSVEEQFNKGNNATFDANGGEVFLMGNEHVILGTTTFFDLTKNASAAATTTFGAGTLTTIEGEWNFTGMSEANRHVIRSGTPGTYWFVNSATNTISNLAVQDSNNVNVSTVICDTGCLDNGNNVNWTFAPIETLSFYSEAPYQFYFGQATTSVGAITITETSSPSITTANDIRISIATTTSNFRFNTGTVSLTYGGSAAGKVSTTVSYEEAGATLVLAVTENFAASDTLVINGVTFGSFGTVTSATSSLELHTDGNTAGVPAAVDVESIRITGRIVAADHTAGQVENEFSAENKNDDPLFAFNLTGQSEVITVSDLVVTLSGVRGLDSSNLSDFKLYRDNDDDGVLDGSDSLVDGGGILTFNGQHGAVTFNTDFIASTSANYLVTADTDSIQLSDSAVFSLQELGVAALGATSNYSPVIQITADTIQHFRNNSTGGGGNVAVGGAAPEGAGVVEGGETGGGEGAGEEMDGENIASDPDFARPSATGEGFNEWTNGDNALLSDGTYATAASTNLRQSYNGFNFNIPGGNTVQGIAVKLDASGTTAAGTIDVSLSWDGGNSYTTAKATPTLSGGDIIYLVGGASDLWGRSWTGAQFSAETFRLRVSAQPSSNTIRLDALEVRVYHQAGGGSSGGGGGI